MRCFHMMEKLVSHKALILFVCRHNTGRSQMAEAYLRHFAGDAVDVLSAGTEAADRPDAGVVAVMAEDGGCPTPRARRSSGCARFATRSRPRQGSWPTRCLRPKAPLGSLYVYDSTD